MGLVLRSVKGSKLTISEMDGNLTYLQSLSGSSEFTGNTSSNTISDIWVDNFHGGTYYGDGSNLTGIVAGASTIPTTHSELVNNINSSGLTSGATYIITDFRTCYDQPDYDNLINPITVGIYKSADTVSPIVVFATSTNTISIDAFQPEFPFDKIKYGYDWYVTEHTGGPMFGRITERIDSYNNRTDYDHRTILFKRYRGYSYYQNSPLGGLVGISGITGNTGILYGNTGTTFNLDFITGSFVAIQNLTPSIFEVISVEGDYAAIISGETISETSNSSYYSAFDDSIMSYYKPNVRANQVYEYTTFGDALEENTAINNYIGNQANLYVEDNNGDFLLANNVFITGEYINNRIGDGSYNNTFNDDCTDNQIGDRFYNNLTNDDFDGNIIGRGFNSNYITANFNNNRIGNYFENNILIGDSFYRNNIGNDFNNNVWTNDDFQNNEIGNQFNNNNIYDGFYKNDIGNGYNINNVYSEYYGNLIGNGYSGNTIYSIFDNNIIGDYFISNIIGDSTNIGEGDFEYNRIGYDFVDNLIKVTFNNNDILNDFNSNDIFGIFRKNKILNDFNGCTIGDSLDLGGITFENNEIMNNFKGNNIQGNFWSNRIKTDFKGNQTFDEFGYNNIGFGCTPNNFSGSTIHNNIGDYFQFNDCYGSFSYNTIGTNFFSNEIQDGFGFGGGNYQGNRIGNNFYDNIVGEYFYNNTIPDNFYNNTIGNYFQWNIVDTNIDNTDFTTYYGNITGFSYSALGGTAVDNIYDSLGGVTNGIGLNATFNVEVSGSTVIDVSLNDVGIFYLCGDTITISGIDIGGYDDAIDAFTTNLTTQTGSSGNYYGLTVTGGTGINATFDVLVDGTGAITDIILDNQGIGYTDGDILLLLGSQFNGTDGVDDITINVTDIITDNITIYVDGVSPIPSVYGLYTCNIFTNSGLIKRLSYYDENDILTIKNINE